MKLHINEANTVTVDIPNMLTYPFHFKGTDNNGWKRDTHEVIVSYSNRGQFVDLILVDDNGVKIGRTRKKVKIVGNDIIITDSDKKDFVIGHIVQTATESIHSYDYTQRLTIADSIAEWIFDGDVDENLDKLENIIGKLDFEAYESPEILSEFLCTFSLNELIDIENQLF